MPIQLTISGHTIEVDQVVGSGATSVVWRCRRADSGALCALKVARRLADTSILAEEAERLIWGMSPSLPRLLGLGRIPPAVLGEAFTEAAPCLLLEWIEGATLRSFSEAHPTLHESVLLGITRDLAQTLSDLHAAGIAHGDIKPDNVMIVQRYDGPHAVLLDMGLATGADSAMPRGGTRRYLAPEVTATAAHGDGDARTRDLWAFGILLAELVDPLVDPAHPEQLARKGADWGVLGGIISPLLAMCPGARPPSSWVARQVEARIGDTGDAADAIRFRQARVRRAYLSVRRNELVAAARARSIDFEIEGLARDWVEGCVAMLRGLDALRGLDRRGGPVILGDLGASARLKFIVELVGSVAASWTLDAGIGDAELLSRIVDTTRSVDPHALTLAAITQQRSAIGQSSQKTPVELALLLSEGHPRRDVLDAAEAYCLGADAAVAFRWALGTRLRLVGEFGRALAVLDRDGSPLLIAEAAETARRAGDYAGALERIRRLDDSTDLLAKSRAAATEGRILLERGMIEQSLALTNGMVDTVQLLELRALAELQLQHFVDARDTLERARTLALSDEEQARILALVGMLHHATSEAPLAVPAFRRAVEHASRSGALLEEATYLTGLSAAAVDSGRLDEAIAASERATALFEALGRSNRAARAALNRVAAFAAVGAQLQAQAAAEVALLHARASKDDRCAANVYLALIDADDASPDAAQYAQRATALLSDASSEEKLILAARCLDSGMRVDIHSLDSSARQLEAGAVAALDWWGARARHALRERDWRGAESVVGEITRLLGARVAAFTRGRAFSAGAQLARQVDLGDAARRLHGAALEDLQQLSTGCSAELRTPLVAREWVKALRAPSMSLLRPEQVADIETLVRALGRWEQLRPLLVQVLDALVLWTGVERGLMLLVAPGGKLQARVGRNIGRSDLVGHQLELSSSLALRALEQGEPIVAVDASGELDSMHASVHALKLRSVLAVPLLARGESLGVVYLDDRIRRGAFGERELAWVRLVGAVAAVAIADARDRLRLRRAARRAERAEKRMSEMLAVREAELGEVRVELARTRDAPPTRFRYEGIIGNSQAMQQLLRMVDRVVVSDVPVLVLGASGTGKELIARAIHKNGARTRQAFVAENCGAIPEALLESALFGHTKGAFTGAARARAGLFEVAHQGTLFLDEIAEMSLGMQTKLLRVLEEGEFWPVGAERSKRVDVRVIAATHRNLDAMVAAGTFRQDLFYRLNVVSLQVPELKDRHGDVPRLVQHFIDRYGGEQPIAIDKPAMELLARYPWPGNVRQLENEIRRAIVLSDDVITPAQLSDEVRRVALETRPVPEGLELRAHLDALERELVIRALSLTQGNQTRAAELLGVSRFGLQKMVRRLDIRNSELGSQAPPSSREPPRSNGSKSGRKSGAF